MAIICIETSTVVCSVATAEKNIITFEHSSCDGPSHAALLGVFVEEALKDIAARGLTVEAVAVSAGPGSYTGLRIGVSTAKGLCFGLNVPLLAIPTLEILSNKVITNVDSGEGKSDAKPLYCPMLDARRMEVYSAIYDDTLYNVRETRAEIITEDSFASYLKDREMVFFGNGSEKCKAVITSPNARFIDNIYPCAVDMAPLAVKALAENRTVDVAYFEPFYLKDFIATVPKNKITTFKKS